MSFRSLVARGVLAGALALALAPGGASAAGPGALDGGFGGGVVQAPAGAQLYGVAVDGSGDTFAAGTLDGQMFVERLSSAGAPAGTYLGPAGVAHAVAVGPDGDVLVAGGSGGAMIVQKLSPSLASPAIWTQTAFVGANAVANGLAVAADGSPVAVGSAGGQTAVAQFSPAGALRWTQADFGSGQDGSQLNAAAVQPNGSVVVVGSQHTDRYINGLVAQISSTGAVQQAFLAYFPQNGTLSLNAAATQPDGNVVVAGATDGPEVVVLRVTQSGAVDQTFGNVPAVGYQSLASLPSGQNVTVPNYPFGGYGVGIAAGNRVISAGNYENTGAASDQALWAFTPTGAPESGLTGGNGTSSAGTATVVGPGGDYEACAMAIDPTTGNIVTAGDSVNAFPVTNPCDLDSSTASSAAQGFISRMIGFGPVPQPPPPPPPPPTPTPSGSAPLAVTGPAHALSGSESLQGTVTPDGLPTTYHFEYGPSTAYGYSTASASAGSGTSPVAVSASLTGLRPATTYHYRLVAANADGTAYGTDATFRTASPAAPPRLTTSLRGLAKSYHDGSVIRQGIALKVFCSAPCAFSVSAVVPAAQASRLGLGKRQITLGKVGGRLRTRGTASLKLRLSAAAVKIVSRHTRLAITLELTAKPAAAGSAARAVAVLHLKP